MSSLTNLGIVCALGENNQQVLAACLRGSQLGMLMHNDLHAQYPVRVGQVQAALPTLAAFAKGTKSRCNQLAYIAYQQIAKQVANLPYAAERIAVIIGTSTSGIESGELAMAQFNHTCQMPAEFHYNMQEMVAPAAFIATLSGAKGPVYSLSSACTSSAKALISADFLLRSGQVDAVIAGGVDSLCKLTINGFAALESIAKDYASPFAQHRDGINIGEGAALFVMQNSTSGVILKGYAENCDAHHISAPAPDGRGAISAMRGALTMAGLHASDVDYLNLHGTATLQNDQMEAIAVNKVLPNTPCSSTKAMTGHTLGAAGAIEAGICWLLMSKFNSENRLPVNIMHGQPDPSLAPINLLTQSVILPRKIRRCLSNSFAFGGNNVALLLVKE